MSNQPVPPAEEQILSNQAFDAELFWFKHKNTIIAIAALVVVVIVALGAWFLHDRSQREGAAVAFATAQNIDGWREVIAKYPKSAPAADAYFLVAESLRNTGDIAGSSSTYEKFLQEFPTSELAGGAQLGLAQNLELQGNVKEALSALQTVRAKYASSYAAPFAALLEGRILVREGKFAEAKTVFTSIVQSYQTSPAAGFASGQLEELETLAN